MYAVIATGGKQYRVEQGDIILVERLPQEPEELVDFEQVLLVSDGNGTKIGDPVLSGAKVTAKVLEQGKGPKVRGMRYRAKKNYRRRYGHRQCYTKVEIQDILV
jgi:large subunit ribosomal protein L21